jgi:hypothetical protein
MGHEALLSDPALHARWASVGSNNPNDSTAGGRNAIWGGAALYEPKPAGVPVEGASFRFDRTTWLGGINLGLTTNTITLMAWVLDDDSAVAGSGLLFNRAGGLVNGLNVANNDRDHWGFHWNTVPATYDWASGPLRTPGQWQHVALRISPTSAVIQVQSPGGQPTESVLAGTYASVAAGASFEVGRDSVFVPPGRYWGGQMNDIRAYSRTLSFAEVASIAVLSRRGRLTARNNHVAQAIAIPTARDVIAHPGHNLASGASR